MRSSVLKLMGAASRGAMLAATLVIGAVASSQVAPSAPHSPWVLANVNVVDTRTGRVARGSSILIDGGTIIRVGPARSLGANGAPRIDGHGAYVVPGYNDMHAHPLNPGSPEGGLQLMLANGITGFRQMSGSPELLARRRAGNFLPPDTPALLATPGNILIPPLVMPTPDAVVAEIDRQHEQGADFIKVVALPPPAFFAGLAEATRLGMRFSGHLLPVNDIREVSDRHMGPIEHLGPNDSILLGCSSDEAAIRQAMAAVPAPPPSIISGPGGPAGAERALANPALGTSPETFARVRRVIDTYSAERCRELMGRFVANRTWQVPTLIRIRTMEFGDDPAYRTDPNLRFIPPPRRQMWQELGQAFGQRISAEQRRIFTDLFALQLGLVRQMDATGVPMMTGSDYGGGWEVAGYSLHQEFDLLASAHVSPLHVLQMTTVNAARFLDREAVMGTVEAGRTADLVLLSANPVASVANLHRIAAVVRGGHYYSRPALDQLRDGVAARIAAQAQSASAAPESIDVDGDGY
jgi:hypothetical protein